MATPDSSPIISGLNTNGLSLNTSRGRQRRGSQNRLSGISSSSEESSPKPQRKSYVTDETSPAIRKSSREVKEKEKISKKTPKILSDGGEKSGSSINSLKKVGRPDSFVLDVSSIMSELLESSGSESEPEREKKAPKTTPTSKKMNGTSFGVKDRVSEDPSPLKTKSKKMETSVSTRSSLVQNRRSSHAADNTSSSSNIDSSPSLSSTGRSKVTGSRSPTFSPSKSRFRTEDNVMDNKPPLAPNSNRKISDSRRLSNKVNDTISNGVDDSSSTGVYERTSKRASEVASKRANDISTKRANGKREEEEKEENEVKLRRRANALPSSATRRDSIQNDKKKEERNSDQFDENFSTTNDMNFRARLDETKVKRSGSFKQRNKMSGDRALGIFYGNKRRSQISDHDVLEDYDKNYGDNGGNSSLESSGSLSTPQSPVAKRTPSNLRLGQDSSTQGAIHTVPLSPLLSSSSSGSETRREAMKKSTESGGGRGGTIPLSPRIVVTDKTSDVSIQAMYVKGRLSGAMVLFWVLTRPRCS